MIEERRMRMEKKINWEKDYDRALDLAKAQNKMVLLDFFSPV